MVAAEGLLALQRFLQRAKNVAADAKKATREVALDVAMEARYLSPSPIRRMANVDKAYETGDAVSYVAETRNPLGIIMEFGSPTLPGGRPFLGPALELHEDDLPEAVEAIVDRWINS